MGLISRISDALEVVAADIKTLYGRGVTNGDAHDHSGGDGAQIAYSSLSGLPTLGTAAAKNTGISGNTVPLLDGTGTTFTNGIGIGVAPGVYIIGSGPGLAMKSSATFAPQVFVHNDANDTSAGYFNLRKSRSGGAVVNDDVLGSFVWAAHTPTLKTSAIIQVHVSDTVSDNVISTKMRFQTAINGVLSDRLVISQSGVGIGTSAPSTALHVNGPIRCGSYTVATVPSAATVGAGTEIYVSNESGGAVLAFSDGTNWRRVTDRAVIS
jgi:hypothetical protein